MQIGDKVPEVLGVDQEGREWRMSDFSGRKVILYFYPKDSTPGCTAEACSLRDHFGELQALGYDILGVSADSAESHQKFAAAQSLPFPLIADTDKRLIEAMGVWGEKTATAASPSASCAPPSSSTNRDVWSASSPPDRFARKSTPNRF